MTRAGVLASSALPCTLIHIAAHTHTCTHSPTQEYNARIQEAIIQCSAIILCKGICCRSRLETYGLLLWSALSLDHACVVAAMMSTPNTCHTIFSSKGICKCFTMQRRCFCSILEKCPLPESKMSNLPGQPQGDEEPRILLSS